MSLRRLKKIWRRQSTPKKYDAIALVYRLIPIHAKFVILYCTLADPCESSFHCWRSGAAVKICAAAIGGAYETQASLPSNLSPQIINLTGTCRSGQFPHNLVGTLR